MPLQATSGAASQDAFGGNGVAIVPTYIEDVFSTWLYTGNGATGQTITNGIDLSTYGGLVWAKGRSTAADSHRLYDTVRGLPFKLQTPTTAAQSSDTTVATVSSFNSNGFTIPPNAYLNDVAQTYASWTFREQPKFFDIVTYTGDGTTPRNINHNLGSVPGCIIIKNLTTAQAWPVYHRSLNITGGFAMTLNTTDATANSGVLPQFFASTLATSTQFTVGNAGAVNNSGNTFVAYLFAHDAGGFGLTGTDNVISCGSFTTDGSENATVSLGYEPQWLLVKPSATVGDWAIFDNMRGWTQSTDYYLNPNTSGDESNGERGTPTATGFNYANNGANTAFIYIAIRRGPMKVPTTGTEVFGISARTGTGANATVTGGQTDDAVLVKNSGSAVASLFSSRLTGTGYLVTSSIAAEVAAGVTILQANPWDVMDGVKVGTTDTITNASANTYINYLFKRAPSFFDVVCYTGTGTAGQTYNHNLTTAPELMIVKDRGAHAEDWQCYTPLGPTKFNRLNSTNVIETSTAAWNDTAPTTSVFTVGTDTRVNGSGYNYVAYLFATLAGVSKIGSYTGNGTTQTIDCGLTAGARFVLLKRTDATGNWYVYDTARGMTVLTDPYWLTNTTAAEVATLGSVTTVATGFALNSTILAAINVNAGTYIFLAIA